jgi:hypothetical protein
MWDKRFPEWTGVTRCNDARTSLIQDKFNFASAYRVKPVPHYGL